MLEKLLGMYRQKEEAKAQPVENSYEPYSIGDEDPIKAFLSAKCVYMLCVTKLGKPATISLEGLKAVCVFIKPYMFDDGYEDMVGLLEYENEMSKNEMFLVKYSQENVFKMMRNFQCDHVYLIDADGWYKIHDYQCGMQRKN